MADDSSKKKKTLEMRVSEMEDKLSQMSLSEEEVETLQKAMAKGCVAPCQQGGGSASTSWPCIIHHCIIHPCIIHCIIHPCIIRTCFAEQGGAQTATAAKATGEAGTSIPAPCVINQCIRPCILPCIIQQCIRPCIIQQCIVECSCGPCSQCYASGGGGGTGGGFGSLGY